MENWDDATGATCVLIKTVQSISAKTYYVLLTKILQGGDTASGTVLHKGVLEFVVKILDKYTYKEFLKIPL